jgi:hypothetical protein
MSMTNPILFAADEPKPEVNTPAGTPAAPQPDPGAPMPDKPSEEKSGK